jgi:hypothetical protein
MQEYDSNKVSISTMCWLAALCGAILMIVGILTGGIS